MDTSAKIIIIGLAAALAVVFGIAAVYASYVFERDNQMLSIATVTGENATTTKQESDAPPQFLFVQQAASGTLVLQEGDTYRLTLNDVSPTTVRFADRPYRYVDTVTVDVFVGNWSAGEDSFAADPPNAALVMHGQSGQDIIVVELLNPVFDSDSNTLAFDAVNLSAGAVPPEFGAASLFIDDAANGPYCAPNSNYC